MSEDGHMVVLNVYDLSQGLARQLSATFLGKTIEAIWHTGVVVYGTEYYFGGGIQHDPAGRTPYGTPIRVVELGFTHVPKDVFEDYLREISPRYTAETYNLLSHNCNNFSNEVVQFLVGATIPDYILHLPNEVINSPMGPLILPMIQRLEGTLKSGSVPKAPQFVPPLGASQPAVPTVTSLSSWKPNGSVKLDDHKIDSKITEAKQREQKDRIPPAVKPAGVQEKAQVNDSLGEARNQVQEEITREFTALMAEGTLRASEAAALATRRVMQRHGHLNVPMSQG